MVGKTRGSRGRFGLLAALTLFHLPLAAQPGPEGSRITGTIDDLRTVRRRLDVHPLARREYDEGEAPPDIRMERMVLVLKPGVEQQKELNRLAAAQQNPHSLEYHRWLSPETFGRRFGVSDSDLAQIVGWLKAHGFAVEPVAPARRVIVFSGSTGQVSALFHTPIHYYNVQGRRHYANAACPELPQALEQVVGGILSLNDFRARPLHHPAARIAHKASAPLFADDAGNHYLAPVDFSAIYDTGPLYANSVDGTGQSIAIVGRTNISLPDVETFRSTSGLRANDPVIVVNGVDPGIVSEDEETEAVLDVEWSGATAPGASVLLVVSASTNASDGVALSAQYIVDQNLAGIVSLSFGSCEQNLGTAANQFWDGLWQQAALQGMTVLVASGDGGVAGCDPDSAAAAVNPPGVNGLCSSTASTCVGGTEFSDGATQGTYWTAAGLATGYIPETAWNESASVGGTDLWATGGGPSTIYAKPDWQSGPGVPSDGWRDVPDVALSAASHDGYLTYMNGSLWAVAGTSAAAPSFAGLMALAAQQTGSRLGNVNSNLYGLASGHTGGAIFHDVTAGDNSVPGLTGYSAGPGYDLATGLGSVDAAQLVAHWNDAAAGGSFDLSGSPPVVSLVQGTTTAVALDVVPSGGFNADVRLSASGLSSGLTASFSPLVVPAGSGASTLTLTADPGAAPGTGNVTIAATGGGAVRYLPVAVTVVAACTYSISPTSASTDAKAGSNSVNVTASNVTTTATCPWTAVSNSYWLAVTSAASGVGNQTVTYSVAANTVGTTRTGIITVAGMAFTVTQAPPPPGFALTAAPSALSVAAGSSVTVGIGVVPTYGFQGNVALTVSGLPAGVGATFLPGVAAAGSRASLELTASAWAATTSGGITVTGTNGNLAVTLPLNVSVAAVPGFSLNANPWTVALSTGSSVTTTVSAGAYGNFTGKVILAVVGLPAGVSAVFTPTAIAPGSTASLKFTAAASALAFSGNITLTGLSGGVTRTAPMTLNVSATPGFTLGAANAAISVAAGSSGTASINVAGQGGFRGNVTLAIASLPAAVAAVFNPPTVAAGGTSTLTLTVSGSTLPFSCGLALTGSSGNLTSTASLQLKVTSAASFTVIATPPSVGVAQGSSVTASVSVAPTNGFTGQVALGVTGLPPGLTASFTPRTVAAGSASLLTLTADPAAATLSARKLVLAGSSGSVTRTSTLMLNVTAAGFTLSANPPSVTLGAGSSAQTTIAVAATGTFTGRVPLAVSYLPTGVTATFTPPTVSPGGSAILQLTALSSAPDSSGNVALTGANGNMTATVPLAVNVNATPGFYLTAAPSSLTLTAGSSITATINVTAKGGFTGNVNLAANGLPAAVTAIFSPPSPAVGSTSTVTLTASVWAPAFSGKIVLTGTSGTVTGTSAFSVNLIPAPGFALTATPQVVTVVAGSSATSTIRIAGTSGFQGTVALFLSGLPPGVTATLPASPMVGGTATLRVTASASAVVSSSRILVTGVSGVVAVSIVLTLNVNAPGFSIRTGAPSLTVGWGLSVSTTVTVVPIMGYGGMVTFSATGLPCGVSAVFTPPAVRAGGKATLTLSSVFGSEITTNVMVTGTSGNLTASSPLSLTADEESVGFQLLASPYFVDLQPGGTATTRITMQPTLGYTGKASLWVPPNILPAGVTATVSPSSIGPGQVATLTLQAAASAPAPTGYIQVQGSIGNAAMGLLRITLNNDAPGFSFEAPYLPTSVLTGFIDTVLVINFSGGFNGDIQLAFSGLPPGVVGSFQPAPAYETNVRNVWFELAAGVTAVASPPTAVTITGTSGNLTASITFNISVIPTTNFWVDPPVEGISDSDYFSTAAGGIATATLLGIGQGAGFTVSLSGVPPNATATLVPSPPSEYIVNIATTSQTPPGCYVISYVGNAPGEPPFTRGWPLILTVTQ